MTLREIRAQLRAAYNRTSFYPRTNETYYPAAWRYGAGVGGASTSCNYDRRISLAAMHMAHDMELSRDSTNHLDYELSECTRLRDAADILSREFRIQKTHDTEIDATLDLALQHAN